MPIYEYRCDNGHNFEVMQRMSDDALTACQVCEAPVQKVLHPVAVHFKGSGFYTTDYGKKKAPGGGSDSKKGESSGSSDSASGSDSGSSSSSDSGSSSGSGSSAKGDSKSSGSASAQPAAKSA